MSEEANDFFQRLQAVANEVAERREADVLLYSGDLQSPGDDDVIELVLKRQRRPNVLLVLCTYGGDPHAAYRIARCLARHYQRFTVVLGGPCKSAGTLLVLGAHELILTERAEFGPLDVQLRKADELAERSSGLTPVQALQTLQQRAQEAFRAQFLSLKLDMLMTTKTAAEVASAFTAGLFQPVYAQIDPMRIGETERGLKIAWDYGKRLSEKSNNLKDGALARLVGGYPSHDFAIDLEEARELFHTVGEPLESDAAFMDIVEGFCAKPANRGLRLNLYLNNELSHDPTPGANPDDSAGRRTSSRVHEGGDERAEANGTGRQRRRRNP